MKTPNHAKIKQAFERQTGISALMVEEVSEAFPQSLWGHIHTADRTFDFKLTWGANIVKGSFKEQGV